ncbi:MAG TPA: peptidylprolyl isomerase [Bacteroidota bacterium]|nr:peptidylprolyl isomerase [Bacteroidota bacterium]
MKSTSIILAFGLLSFIAGGCGSSNPVVATVDGEKITLADFEDSYAKNNGGWSNAVSSSLNDRERFLDLLVKFRLKVMEGKNQGLMRDSAVMEELDTYRLSVAQSYTLEKELIAPRIREMYDHKLEEIHGAHILIRMPQNPTPADTLAAYEKAMKALSLIATAGFDSAARAYSDDTQSGKLGGDIGWVVPGRAYPDFEEALYSLHQGDYTRSPVRTPFGYHIIKCIKRQPAAGAVRISHILRRFNPDLKDTAAVADTVQRVYTMLRHGADFASLAEQYSEDPGSRQRGGDIGYYERDRLRPDIVSLLFDLPTDSIPAPYRQQYGYHIFKVTGHRPLASFGEMEKDLRSEYQQTRYQNDLAQYLTGLKRLYHFSMNQPVEQELRGAFDTTSTPNDSAWSQKIPAILLPKTLFSCSGGTFSVQDFVDSVGQELDFRATLLKPVNVDAMVDRLAGAYVLRVHALKAVDAYPDLKNLLNEYLDGILLYRIEQDEVWKKVVANDSLLKIFYDSTMSNYRWPSRVNFAEIFVTSDSAKKGAEAMLAKGTDFLTVAEEYTARPGYRDKLGIWGFQPYNLNDLTLKAGALDVGTVTGFFSEQNGWSNIKVIAKDSAHTKTFEEAGPELASAYQEQASRIREEQWIESLKHKYGVTLHNDILMEAFKRKRIETN